MDRSWAPLASCGKSVTGHSPVATNVHCLRSFPLTPLAPAGWPAV